MLLFWVFGLPFPSFRLLFLCFRLLFFLEPKSKSNWFFRVTISHSGYHFENCCKWPKNSYHWTKILLRSSWSTCFFCQNQYQLNWMWKNSNVSKNCNLILENGNVNKNGNMVTCYHFDTYFLAPYILTLMQLSGYSGILYLVFFRDGESHQ